MLPFAFKTFFFTKTNEEFSACLRLLWITHYKVNSTSETVRRSKIYSSQFTRGGLSKKKLKIKKVHPACIPLRCKILITLAHAQTKCLSATRDAIGSLAKWSRAYDLVTSLEN